MINWSNVRIVQWKYERKNGADTPNRIFIPSLLSIPARVLWQLWPGTLLCAVFWFVAVVDEPFRWQRRTRLGKIASGPFYIGVFSNALVTLANSGYMPGTDIEEQYSLWKPPTETTYLLWLGDNYYGASIGDIFIGIGVLFMLVLACLTPYAEKRILVKR